MNYYTSLTVLLVGFKLSLAMILIGPYVWHRFRRGACNRFEWARRVNTRLDEHRAAKTRVALQSSRKNRVQAFRDNMLRKVVWTASREGSGMTALPPAQDTRAAQDNQDLLVRPGSEPSVQQHDSVNWSQMLRASFLLLLIACVCVAHCTSRCTAIVLSTASPPRAVTCSYYYHCVV